MSSRKPTIVHRWRSSRRPKVWPADPRYAGIMLSSALSCVKKWPRRSSARLCGTARKFQLTGALELTNRKPLENLTAPTRCREWRLSQRQRLSRVQRQAGRLRMAFCSVAVPGPLPGSRLDRCDGSLQAVTCASRTTLRVAGRGAYEAAGFKHFVCRRRRPAQAIFQRSNRGETRARQ